MLGQSKKKTDLRCQENVNEHTASARCEGAKFQVKYDIIVVASHMLHEYDACAARRLHLTDDETVYVILYYYYLFLSLGDGPFMWPEWKTPFVFVRMCVSNIKLWF